MKLNYLYTADAVNIRIQLGHLRVMIRVLRWAGFPEIADESGALLREIKRSDRLIAQRLNALREVWRVVERWQDGELTREAMEHAVEEHRPYRPPSGTVTAYSGSDDDELDLSNPPSGGSAATRED